jgi:hypothetical protein
MKQTAVEWLAEQINGLDTAVSLNYFKQKVEQAKEMEKQQIIDAYRSGVYDGGENVSQYNMNAEQYYTETFKQQEQ